MNYSKKRLGIIAIIVSILVIAGVAFWKLSQQTETASNERLIPQEQLTIAGHRAISACQALPEASVVKIYGELGPKSDIRESYVDASVTKSQLDEYGSIDAECFYDFSDSENSTLSLKIEQFGTPEEANEDWKRAADLGDGSTEKVIQDYQTMINNGTVVGDEAVALQNLLNDMNASLPNAKREGGTAVSGLNNSILFNPSRGTFLVVYNNSLLTLDYKFGSANVFDPSRAIDGKEVGRITSRIKKTFDVIFANIENPSLSQAPAPTLRNKNNAFVGETKILEPCEFLTEKVKTAAFGAVVQTQPVERLSTNKDTQSTRTHVNKYPLLPYNECTKNYEIGSDSEIETMYISLQLGYADSSERARGNSEGTLNTQGIAAKNISDITTKADYAKFRSSLGSYVNVQNVRFQKDGYAGLLTISRSDKNRDPVATDKAVFQTVTDLIVDQLP